MKLGDKSPPNLSTDHLEGYAIARFEIGRNVTKSLPCARHHLVGLVADGEDGVGIDCDNRQITVVPRRPRTYLL